MRVVILGGGISGLIAAHVLKNKGGVDVTLIEAGDKLGGTFAAGGLKYLRATKDASDMLDALGIHYSFHLPRGAIYIDGVAKSHPECLMGMSTLDRLQIQTAHWKKTRKSLEGFRADCMNDPGSKHNWSARCDNAVVVAALAKQAEESCKVHTFARVRRVDAKSVTVHDRNVPYDFLINTLPLPVLRKIVPFTVQSGIPDTSCNKLSIVDVSGIQTDMWWDYLYTPLASTVSRITKTSPTTAQLEIPWGKPDAPKPLDTDDLMPLLSHRSDRDMFVQETLSEPRVLNGHLKPLPGPLVLPKNWLMLGRFAEWDPRSTAEKSLTKMIQWAHDQRF